MQRRLAGDAVVVHVDPARAVGVVDGDAVQVHPDAGVDGADTRQLDAEAAVGVRPDQYLVDRFVRVEAMAVEGAAPHREGRDGGGGSAFGGRWRDSRLRAEVGQGKALVLI
jgi:hypothetical protein